MSELSLSAQANSVNGSSADFNPTIARPAWARVGNPRPALTPAPPPRARRRTHPPALIEGALRSYAILHCLQLYEADARAIEKHYGLSAAQSHRAGIRSCPSEITKLFTCDAIERSYGGRFTGALPAPFYRDEGGALRMNTPRAGLMVPVRRGGLIHAWRYYRHAGDAAPRWITSNGKPSGRPASPSIHVVNPQHARRTGLCYLVSHALAAEALGAIEPLTFAAVNGLSPFNLAAQLIDVWPRLRRCLLWKLDPDPFLTRTLSEAGLKVEVA
jgi:hypothetical protein